PFPAWRNARRRPNIRADAGSWRRLRTRANRSRGCRRVGRRGSAFISCSKGLQFVSLIALPLEMTKWNNHRKPEREQGKHIQIKICTAMQETDHSENRQ